MKDTFIAKCLLGEAFTDEIDDYVEAWHSSHIYPVALDVFLGMTMEEYKQWAFFGVPVEDIVEARANHIFQSIFVEA